jgi:hypothetical protein
MKHQNVRKPDHVGRGGTGLRQSAAERVDPELRVRFDAGHVQVMMSDTPGSHPLKLRGDS